MTVNATSFSANSTPPGAAPAPPPKITSDFNTFLRMLTVQMKNQDPLNPIDSADYAMQLATFSGVEQQVRTNQLLAEMTSKFQQMDMAGMASWIGQEARSNAPVYFDGSPVTLSPNPAQGATGAVVVVKDAQGRLVSREQIPATAQSYQWLGADAAGNRLPTGVYTVTLESLKGEQVIDNRPIEHYAPVIEVRGGPGGAKLVLDGGVEVLASAVTALRKPPS
ncbi:MAG: flagellar basal body rod modification protein [Rhodobacter sp.]|nr:flagellar basal body rod modification protein [Rhodobacter sp.]